MMRFVFLLGLAGAQFTNGGYESSWYSKCPGGLDPVGSCSTKADCVTHGSSYYCAPVQTSPTGPVTQKCCPATIGSQCAYNGTCASGFYNNGCQRYCKCVSGIEICADTNVCVRKGEARCMCPFGTTNSDGHCYCKCDSDNFCRDATHTTRVCKGLTAGGVKVCVDPVVTTTPGTTCDATTCGGTCFGETCGRGVATCPVKCPYGESKDSSGVCQCPSGTVRDSSTQRCGISCGTAFCTQYQDCVTRNGTMSCKLKCSNGQRRGSDGVCRPCGGCTGDRICLAVAGGYDCVPPCPSGTIRDTTNPLQCNCRYGLTKNADGVCTRCGSSPCSTEQVCVKTVTTNTDGTSTYSYLCKPKCLTGEVRDHTGTCNCFTGLTRPSGGGNCTRCGNPACTTDQECVKTTNTNSGTSTYSYSCKARCGTNEVRYGGVCRCKIGYTKPNSTADCAPCGSSPCTTTQDCVKVYSTSGSTTSYTYTCRDKCDATKGFVRYNDGPCVCRDGTIKDESTRSCVCKDGTVKDSATGRCIPNPTTTKTTTTSETNNTDSTCSGDNEVWFACATECEPTCASITTKVACVAVCKQEGACQCKLGFYRHNGKCVDASECPSTGPTCDTILCASTSCGCYEGKCLETGDLNCPKPNCAQKCTTGLRKWQCKRGGYDIECSCWDCRNFAVHGTKSLTETPMCYRAGSRTFITWNQCKDYGAPVLSKTFTFTFSGTVEFGPARDSDWQSIVRTALQKWYKLKAIANSQSITITTKAQVAWKCAKTRPTSFTGTKNDLSVCGTNTDHRFWCEDSGAIDFDGKGYVTISGQTERDAINKIIARAKSIGSELVEQLRKEAQDIGWCSGQIQLNKVSVRGTCNADITTSTSATTTTCVTSVTTSGTPIHTGLFAAMLVAVVGVLLN